MPGTQVTKSAPKAGKKVGEQGLFRAGRVVAYVYPAQLNIFEVLSGITQVISGTNGLKLSRKQH